MSWFFAKLRNYFKTNNILKGNVKDGLRDWETNKTSSFRT